MVHALHSCYYWVKENHPLILFSFLGGLLSSETKLFSGFSFQETKMICGVSLVSKLAGVCILYVDDSMVLFLVK